MNYFIEEDQIENRMTKQEILEYANQAKYIIKQALDCTLDRMEESY